MADLARLFSVLIRFETELWNAVDRRLRAVHDLPLNRFEPLGVIDRHGACRVNDIAEELVITVGGASKLVDRIEAAGHCRRTANPDDGRSSIIELTPAGKALHSEATTTFHDELDRRLGQATSERELDRLTATLTELRAAGRQLDETDLQPDNDRDDRP